MEGIKESGQAVGAQVLTELTGFAPPTIMAQAARLQARQRMFNLVVTNVPGPQIPLYMLGRRAATAMFPMVPLAANQALGIAIMSYNGQLNFGLNADYDALPDLEVLADELRAAIDELVDGGRPQPAGRSPVGAGLGDRARSDPRVDVRAAAAGRCHELVERTLIVVVSLAISIGVIALLSGGLLAGRDDPGVSAGQAGPGHRLSRPGRRAPARRRAASGL